MTEFAVALEQLRKLMKWSQTEMGEAIGLSRTGYNDCVNGRRTITPEHLKKAAKATNTTLVIFFLDNNSFYTGKK